MSVGADILVPCLVLMGVAGVAPYLWARVLPEGVKPLFANAGLSAICCAGVAILIRFGLILPGWGSTLEWVGLTAIIWAPVLILATAQQPKRWTDVEW